MLAKKNRTINAYKTFFFHIISIAFSDKIKIMSILFVSVSYITVELKRIMLIFFYFVTCLHVWLLFLNSSSSASSSTSSKLRISYSLTYLTSQHLLSCLYIFLYVIGCRTAYAISVLHSSSWRRQFTVCCL